MDNLFAKAIAFAALPIVKWSAIVLGSLVAAALVILFGLSEWRLSRTYDAPQIALRDIGRAPSIERGERWSKVFACQGCHKESGGVMFDRPFVGRVVAPNLTRIAADYSDAELIVAIRAGIKRDGTSAAGMPTDAFAWMADEDVADIIAWLRALKPLPDATDATTSLGPLARLAILNGGFRLSADLPRAEAPPLAQPNGSAREHGDYLSKVLCSHCHRLNEEHVVRPGSIAPALAPMAQGYDVDQFRRLMRTGEPIGDRKLDLMSEVSLGALRHLDDAEIAALHDYLASVAVQTAGSE